MQEIQLDGNSRDITKDNIEKLKEIFPEVFNEDKIDFEKLQAVLGENVDTEDEKYRFTWNGKMDSLRLSQIPSNGTLRPCKEDSKDWDTTQNLYIEGDNLEILKLLQNSYLNKIKMIYIDPPYNTGNDFVYADDFKDSIENYKKMTGQIDSEGNSISTNKETDGRYHTNWLNMMYPRLRLARNLLKDEGVVFISIDDHEVDNLRKICDEIFGIDNFIGELPTIMNLKGNNDEFAFAGTHEYTIVYAKNKASCKVYEFPIEDESIDEWTEDEYGYYKQGANLKSTGGNAPRKKRPNLFFPIFINKSNEAYVTLDDKPLSETDIKILPITDGQEMSWRWEKKKFLNEPYNVIVNCNNGNYSIYKKQRPSLGDLPTKKPKTTLYKPEYSSGNGTVQIKDLFNAKVFTNPKPLDLIKDFIHIGLSGEDEYVIDFFSGSATTAHSIMKLNGDDSGKRKYILVQLQECLDISDSDKKIAVDFLKSINKKEFNLCELAKERIRRAGDKIKQEIEQENQQLKLGEEPKKVPDIGFKVFKLDSSNIRKWNPDAKDLERSLLDQIDNFVDGRSEEDALYEIILKCGLELTVPVEELNIKGKKVYSVGLGALIVCLDNDITLDVANEIAKIETVFEDKQNVTVVFKDNGFRDDSVKTNVKETIRAFGIGKFITV